MKTQMHLRASSHLFGFAKSLRKNQIHMDPTVQLEDENKEINLIAGGFMVIRFSNNQVLEDIESVMKTIYSVQETRSLFLLSLDAE